MGFLRKLFGRKKETLVDSTIVQNNVMDNSPMLYYIYMDEEIFGPFTILELKNDYPIMEDTLITVDALNGEWFEAKYFECFDDLFNRDQGFYINEYGEIIKTK